MLTTYQAIGRNMVISYTSMVNESERDSVEDATGLAGRCRGNCIQPYALAVRLGQSSVYDTSSTHFWGVVIVTDICHKMRRRKMVPKWLFGRTWRIEKETLLTSYKAICCPVVLCNSCGVTKCERSLPKKETNIIPA